MEELTREERLGSILLPSRTNSEWDNCNAFVIELTQDVCRELFRKMRLVESIDRHERDRQSTPPAYLAFYEEYGTFINVEEPDDWNGEDTDAPVPMASFSQETLDLVQPESKLDTHISKFTASDVRFTAYGKYTSDEFWSSPLTMEFLTNYYNEHYGPTPA